MNKTIKGDGVFVNKTTVFEGLFNRKVVAHKKKLISKQSNIAEEIFIQKKIKRRSGEFSSGNNRS